jgi:tRNA threonylcarbamoyladenosine biosynthesis protein TsaB
VTVLGIDTATGVTTVGVCRDGEVLAERSESRGDGHASSLPALVETALADAGVGRNALGGVAVSIGPGSFTGLRVGISFAKGFCWAAGVPIVGVPTLAALAAAAPDGEILVPCLDARRGQVYLGAYRRRGDRVEELLEARAVAPEAAAATVRSLAEAAPEVVVLGDAAERYADAFGTLPAPVRIVPLETCPPRGGAVAREGERRLRSGERPPVETIAPAYARPSEAEIRRRSGSLTLEKAL